MTLPGDNQSPLPTEVRTRFDRFRAAVLTHEEHHVAIRQQHLDEIAAAVRDMPPESDCAALGRQVRLTVDRIMQAERAAQRRFDDDEDARVRAACASLDRQQAALRTQLSVLNPQSANYNTALLEHAAIIEQRNWCALS